MAYINQNFWQLTKIRYESGLLSGVYNNSWPEHLRVEEIDPTYENLKPLMDKLSELWGWKDQDRYNEQALREKLARPNTVLYHLCDDNDSDIVIGYALVSEVQKPFKDRFWPAANDVKILEVDNLGLFPTKEGRGRGKAFFEMIFDKHFVDNNIVYWSQHETHAPTLTRFYRDKMQMEYLGTDQVPDFRQRPAVA